jgi:hypothetical protein
MDDHVGLAPYGSSTTCESQTTLSSFANSDLSMSSRSFSRDSFDTDETLLPPRTSTYGHSYQNFPKSPLSGQEERINDVPDCGTRNSTGIDLETTEEAEQLLALPKLLRGRQKKLVEGQTYMIRTQQYLNTYGHLVPEDEKDKIEAQLTR